MIFVAGAFLRILQALLQAAPTILVGLFVAAILQRFLRRKLTRRTFGDGTWRSLLHAWLIGMLLPVCSFGVVPIAREMRRAKISGGTILAFAISAPLFNPLSLLYGLTLSEPVTILVFALCSLVVVTVVGGVWDWLFRDRTNSSSTAALAAATTQTESEDVEPPPVRHGVRRLLSLVVFAARESVGASSLYIAIGLLGVGLLAIVLPHGSLQRSLNGDNPYAPLVMTVVGLPAYATPMVAMSQLGSMFQHGNSIGAAFALLTLGAGMNLGLAAWMIAHFGWRKSTAWVAMLIAVVLVLAYGVDKPLMPRDIDPADHSHAFDNYCQPFHGHETDLLFEFRSRVFTAAEAYELLAAAALLAVTLLGCVLRICDPDGRVERWLEAPPEPVVSDNGSANTIAAWYERPLPAPILGAVALVMLVVFSVVGCFAYYPEPRVALEQISELRTQALHAAHTKQTKVAVHWIEEWDSWTRKLEVGTYLRYGALSDYHRMKARILRDKLELLEHELEEGDIAEIRHAILSLQRSHSQLVTAFRDEL